MGINRDFDIAILGANGWTAVMCCEHIVRHYPTTLQWTIAGRSQPKLEALAAHLKTLDPDRAAPHITVLASLDLDVLEPLARRTAVFINGIGPYHRYATPVVEACARAGTHYVDLTTETLWVADMVRRYDAVARESGAVIIPSASISSAPSDLIAWLLASRSGSGDGGARVSDVVASGKLTMLGMQGGSSETVLGVAERYGIGWFWAPDPWVMSAQRRVAGASTRRAPLLSRLLGYRHDAILGHLGTSFMAAADQAVVQRSAGLQPEVYGEDFVFREYIPATGWLRAVMIHVVTKLGILLLAIPWFRALVRAKMWQPGTGPDREESRKTERAEYKAVGFAKGRSEPVAVAQFAYDGALTDISAILAVEAAGTLLELARQGKGKGGLLTPSTLGLPFVERLRCYGVDLRIEEIRK
ncbi:hypothetical protein F5B20DRAFT_198085 [Whalleya microplaca]|nr:hypothetical protein F5B20DRAFT_198085 [Whalleya microplaca]